MSIFDRFKLTGKRLFITGGSRGLGREMAVAIADAGADVILVGRDQPSLEKTAGDIRASAGKPGPSRPTSASPTNARRRASRPWNGTPRSTSSSTTWAAGARTSPRKRCRSTSGVS